MRTGRWTKRIDYGEGSADAPGFPPMPDWFGGNADMPNLTTGLRDIGFSDDDIAALMGGNWARFFRDSFGRAI